jgi:hypothetical protein
MAWAAEGLFSLCPVVLGYGICWVLAVRPLRRTVAAQNAAENGSGLRVVRDHVELAEGRLPVPAGPSLVAGLLPPRDRAVPAGAAVEPDGATSHGPQIVGSGVVYFERLEFSIVWAEPAEAEPRLRIAVERDLVPQPVRYSNPEAVTQRAHEDSDFRERLAGTAADYFVGEYGDPVVDWATRQVWVTSQSFPETDLAGICGRVSEELAAIVEWPLTEAGRGLGIPAPVNGAGAAIGADLVLEPVTRPLKKAARLCEIVGVGIGLLTGCHPLALASAKLLAKSEIHKQVARGIVEAGKLVFHGEPLPWAEPGDRSAAAESSRKAEPSRGRRLSPGARPLGRPPGALDPGRPKATSGWDGRRAAGGSREPRHVREPHSMAPGRPGAHEQREEPGPIREPHRMAPGRPGAHEQREEPSQVREPHRHPFWEAGRDEDVSDRDANRDRDDDDRGRGGRA